jgi:hypothetical protein
MTTNGYAPARYLPVNLGQGTALAARRLSVLTGLLWPGVQEVPAGALAAAAGLGADPAMRHVGMPLALIAAALADGRARPYQQPGGGEVTPGRAAKDADGGGADIGAVQAQPDARDHFGEVLLAQVSVGVGSAGLGAVAGRVDGGRQQPRIDMDGVLVGVHHLLAVAHAHSLGDDAATVLGTSISRGQPTGDEQGSQLPFWEVRRPLRDGGPRGRPRPSRMAEPRLFRAGSRIVTER